MKNDSFPPPHGRMSDVDFGGAANNPFDGSYNSGLDVSLRVINWIKLHLHFSVIAY